MQLQSIGVFEFTRTGTTTLKEANTLVGILNRITSKHNEIVNKHIARLEALSPNDTTKTQEIEGMVNKEIEDWNNKVRKLGGHPKGLWLVDFDSGDGYYCWKFPETEIKYWHDYNSGFISRILISERPYANSVSPDKSTPREL